MANQRSERKRRGRSAMRTAPSARRGRWRGRPRTQLSGEPLPGAGDARARAIVAFVTDRCPEARIDLATREFAKSGAPPEQLASVDELATHEAGLA
jgi:hypothetical protein